MDGTERRGKGLKGKKEGDGGVIVCVVEDGVLVPCSWLACSIFLMITKKQRLLYFFLTRVVEKWAKLPVPSPVRVSVSMHVCTDTPRYKFKAALCTFL